MKWWPTQSARRYGSPQQAKHEGQRSCCGVVVQSVKNSQELSYIMWPYRRFYPCLCEPACRTQGNAVQAGIQTQKIPIRTLCKIATTTRTKTPGGTPFLSYFVLSRTFNLNDPPGTSDPERWSTTVLQVSEPRKRMGSKRYPSPRGDLKQTPIIKTNALRLFTHFLPLMPESKQLKKSFIQRASMLKNRVDMTICHVLDF